MKYNKPNWREDAGLTCNSEYRRTFAIFPIKCSDDTKVWGSYYYKKYDIWTYESTSSFQEYKVEDYTHTDYIENITSAEYIVRKLIEGI